MIQVFLAPKSDPSDYASAAQRLGMKEGAVRMAVHRMRQRYGELFREEVAHTVGNGEIEEEINYLRRILSEF